jgi:anaerobic dimethyl sulfoxide reductase subunit C (anchor subunit)
MLKEWPLVAFTVAGQTAVGLFLAAGIPLFFLRSAAPDAPARGSRLAVVLTTLGLMAAASALSFFHLRHPFRAVRALANVRTSWLSREILFELAFMALLAVLALLVGKGVGEGRLHRALFVAAGLSGALFVWSMSRIYMLAAIPVWDRLFTPVSFFLTALMLGGLAAAALFGTGWSAEGPHFKLLLTGCLALIAAAFLSALLLAPGHGLLSARPAASLLPPGSASMALHAARLALLGGGFAALAAAALKGAAERGAQGTPFVPAAAAGLLALLAEVLGRFHFYGQVGRLGR